MIGLGFQFFAQLDVLGELTESTVEALLVGVVVAVDCRLPLLGLDLAVDALVLVVLPLEEVLDELQHVRELREDEHLLALIPALLQQLLHQHHLAARSVQLLHLLLGGVAVTQQVVIEILD